MIDTCATRDEAPAATDYDVLVVGAGIGGMESALKLGDMGYKVLLVEKDASVGGKMILLSKVFPTLDCASCISTPKMASTIHHPNIEAMTYGRVDQIRTAADGTFTAKVTQKARFVDIDTCTGCQKCETACTVAVPDQFNADLVARRAAHITFPQAVPKKAVIDRAGSSPCSFACPAGIQAHGYVSLIRSGLDEEAYRLVLDATPLVGTLGRACYAPCEGDCTRGSLEGTLPIRRLKRFASDAHDASGADNGMERPQPNGKRVAIVGSGPTGLTAAWQLARLGYAVRIFEAAPVAGGFLRLGIPSYRLPEAVVERDIENVTDLGVEIVTGTTVTDPAGLKDDGFDAVLVATGTHRSTSLGVPGEDRLGVLGGTDFLRKVKLNHPIEIAGRRVIVVGGGNVAMDAARTARRLGAASVTIAYRRSRDEMPAHHVEAVDAEKEGVDFRLLVAPAEVLGNADGAVSGLRCVEMRLGAPDASGRRSAEPIPGSDVTIEADVIIAAIGMRPDTAAFGDRVATLKNGRLACDVATCQTAVPHVFAAGDAVHGPTDITRAVGEGRKAAHQVDAWLNGRAFDDWDTRLPVVDKEAVLARQKAYSISAATPDGMELLARADRLPRGGGSAHRGGGPPCRRPVHRLRRLLRVQRVRQRVPRGRLHRPARHGPGARGQGRRGRRVHRLQALPGRPQARVRLRRLQERDHRHADGPAARAHAAVQHDPAPGRRQGPRADRLHPVHGLPRRDREQPALLPVLLHVLHQAEPAPHGRPAPGRHHRPLHGHPGPGQALRRVLRAGEGDGRHLRQGPHRRRQRDARRATSSSPTRTSRTAARSRRPSTTWWSSPWASSPTATPSGCSTSTSWPRTSGSGWTSRRRT